MNGKSVGNSSSNCHLFLSYGAADGARTCQPKKKSKEKKTVLMDRCVTCVTFASNRARAVLVGSNRCHSDVQLEGSCWDSSRHAPLLLRRLNISLLPTYPFPFQYIRLVHLEGINTIREGAGKLAKFFRWTLRSGCRRTWNGNRLAIGLKRP